MTAGPRGPTAGPDLTAADPAAPGPPAPDRLTPVPILDQMARHVWGMFAPRIRPGSVPPPDEDVPLWRDEMETLAGMVRAAVPAPPAGLSVCGHAFDAMVCVAPAGHEGPHITSNERFPHGLPRLVPGAPAAARRAPTAAMIAAAYVAMWGKAPECEAPMVIAERTHRVHDVLRAALAAQGEPDSSPGGVRPP